MSTFIFIKVCPLLGLVTTGVLFHYLPKRPSVEVEVPVTPSDIIAMKFEADVTKAVDDKIIAGVAVAAVDRTGQSTCLCGTTDSFIHSRHLLQVVLDDLLNDNPQGGLGMRRPSGEQQLGTGRSQCNYTQPCG